MYVESGDVLFGYVHLAFLGEDSLTSAAASECAAEQDKFWEYHDALFEEENYRKFDKENLKRFGSELGLDAEQFNECIDSGRTLALVEQDNAFARQLGINSTPTFALNGKAIQGALPFEQFQTIIDGELAK